MEGGREKVYSITGEQNMHMCSNIHKLTICSHEQKHIPETLPRCKSSNVCGAKEIFISFSAPPPPPPSPSPPPPTPSSPLLPHRMLECRVVPEMGLSTISLVR